MRPLDLGLDARPVRPGLNRSRFACLRSLLSHLADMPPRERRRMQAGADTVSAMNALNHVRLTQFAHGGGCACKIPPGELEAAVARLIPEHQSADLLIGVEHGDDAAVVRISPDRAVVATADFFTPVVDDAFTFGRIAAANALRDIYAVGGEPLVALNLLGWPRDKLSYDLAAEVLAGGLEIARQAGCHVAGGHSIDDPEPKYGMAVTGLATLPAAADRRRPGPAAAVADQAAGHWRAQLAAQGHGRGQCRRDRGHDHAECGRQPVGARRRPPLRDRRDGVRAAGACVQARAGERGHGRHRPQPRAVSRRSPRGPVERAHTRWDPA